MSSLLNRYIRDRNTYIKSKLDLQEAIADLICKKDGGDPDMIRDIVEWEGSIIVLVSDENHKNTRQLIFTMEEIEEALHNPMARPRDSLGKFSNIRH